MLNAIKNPKKKAWVVIGVSAAFVLGSAGMVWMDHGKIGEEEQKIESLRAEVSKADARIAKIPNHENRVLRGRVVVKEYAKILPNDKDIHDFVDRITEFSSASGVIIEELNDSDARNRGNRQSKDPFQKINYKLKLRGTLAETLDFINRFESYARFVKIAQIKIKTENDARNSSAQNGPQRHGIDLELETYVYEPGRSLEAVDIRNAEKRTFEMLEKDPLAVDLKLDSYDFRLRPDRRDPFVDPRRAEGTIDPSSVVAEEAAAEQAARIQQLADRFAALRKDADDATSITSFVNRMEFNKRLARSLIEFKQEVEQLDQQGYFTKTELRDRFQSEIVSPFGAFFAEREKLGGETLALQELESQLETFTRAFGEGRYADVVDGTQMVLTIEMSDAADPEVRRVVQDLRTIAARAAARMEFAAMSLAITGFVHQPIRPERSVVIINDRAYSPGDVLDDGIVVRSVEPARVVFLYKLEEIERALD